MHKTDEVVITHFFVKSYKTTRTKKHASACFFKYVDLCGDIGYNKLTTQKENRHETDQKS